jgi:hypothetical protein
MQLVLSISTVLCYMFRLLVAIKPAAIRLPTKPDIIHVNGGTRQILSRPYNYNINKKSVFQPTLI